MSQDLKYAVITALYKGQKYSSIPLPLEQNSANLQLVMTLAEQGTSTSNMIKFPVSNTAFMVFSKEQLNETLFEVDILDSLPGVKKSRKSEKTELLKS